MKRICFVKNVVVTPELLPALAHALKDSKSLKSVEIFECPWFSLLEMPFETIGKFPFKVHFEPYIGK